MHSIFCALAISMLVLSGPAPAVAQNDDVTICFSVNSDNWKLEEFYDRALAACDRLIASGSGSRTTQAFYHRGRGYWLGEMKRYESAIAAYDRAIELDPQHVEGYDFRGLAYQKREDWSRAIVDFNQAIRLDPSYAPAYFRRGYSYEKLSLNDRAKADYQAALKLPSKNRIYEWAHEQARIRLRALGA
jgi:tetratricopeptide (TPR) repeat protein